MTELEVPHRRPRARAAGGASAASSAIVHSPSAARMRFAHPPQRIPDVALRVLLAGALVGRARGHGHRTVDRLNHVGDRDQRRHARQLIAAARALVRRQQTAADQTLKHLRQQLDRNVVLLGDLAGARRSAIAPQGQVFHGHQRVVGLFRESQHIRGSEPGRAREIRPSRSYISISAGSDQPCRSSPGCRPSGSGRA